MGVLNLANSLIDVDTLGKGFKFPMTVDPATNDWQLSKYEENVKECIYWLLATRIGERVMNEDIGTTITESLFMNIESLAVILPNQITEAITRYEPRVTNLRVKVERTGETELRATLTWTVRATGRRDNLVYPYYTEPPVGGI